MHLRKPARIAVIVPFSEDDEHPIQGTTLQAIVDALEDACAFRHLESKTFALAKLLRVK